MTDELMICLRWFALTKGRLNFMKKGRPRPPLDNKPLDTGLPFRKAYAMARQMWEKRK